MDFSLLSPFIDTGLQNLYGFQGVFIRSVEFSEFSGHICRFFSAFHQDIMTHPKQNQISILNLSSWHWEDVKICI